MRAGQENLHIDAGVIVFGLENGSKIPLFPSNQLMGQEPKPGAEIEKIEFWDSEGKCQPIGRNSRKFLLGGKREIMQYYGQK